MFTRLEKNIGKGVDRIGNAPALLVSCHYANDTHPHSNVTCEVANETIKCKIIGMTSYYMMGG